ncbi:hypothetical protein ACH4D5_19910 [Streptomyces sp. NPDC018029]|uniref:hypothetical protein n=1 Tax=Streptomyces sp. NPDC018029 TaxID=3365032 RepID=UPI00379DE50D
MTVPRQARALAPMITPALLVGVGSSPLRVAALPAWLLVTVRPDMRVKDDETVVSGAAA